MANMVAAYRLMNKYPEFKDTFSTREQLSEWLLAPNHICNGEGPLFVADDGRLDLFEEAIKDKIKPKYKTVE